MTMNALTSVAASFQHLYRPVCRVFSQPFFVRSREFHTPDGRHDVEIRHAWSMSAR